MRYSEPMVPLYQSTACHTPHNVRSFVFRRFQGVPSQNFTKFLFVLGVQKLKTPTSFVIQNKLFTHSLNSRTSTY